jgi:Ca2+-binding RTX toxin-like protein
MAKSKGWDATKFSLVKGASYSNTGVIEQVVLDANGDGKLDLIVLRGWNPEKDAPIPISLFLNKGKGHFEDATVATFGSSIPTTVHPSAFEVVDLNGDGRLDLFVPDIGKDSPSPQPGAQNQLLLSHGATGFLNATAQLPQVRDYSHSVGVGDIDHDGDQDIVIMNISSGGVSEPYTMINNGDGQFVRVDDRLPAEILAPPHLFGFTATLLFDANNDGWEDLYVGPPDSDRLSPRLYLNDHSGSFASVAPSVLPGASFPDAFAWGAQAIDINADGAADIVHGLYGNQANFGQPAPTGIQILVNDGLGHFADETATRLPQKYEQMFGQARALSADINGDGYLDLYHTDSIGPTTNPFFLNDGTGHFVQVGIPGLPPAQKITIADMDGDGRNDILFVDRFDLSDSEIGYQLWTARDPGKKVDGTGKPELLIGDGSKETISSLGGTDVVFAAAGNDKLLGGGGADYLNGGDGNDNVDGEGGKDTIVGALGRDKLTGDGGKDIFKFNAIGESAVGKKHDVITDFKGDKIDLSFIDADTALAGDQAFTFIGKQDFAAYAAAHPGARGLARFDKGLLQADLDGNGTADFEVKVGGKLDAGDLIL